MSIMTPSTTPIKDLIASFEKQYAWYRELHGEIEKALQSVVMSQGDLSMLTACFARKKEIMQHIEQERSRIEPAIRTWMAQKHQLRQDPLATRLDTLLQRTESAIQDFLHTEEQLKHYLESLMHTESAGPKR